MKKYLLLLSVILNLNLFAQVTVSIDAIEFPEVFINSPDSISFYIINNNQNEITVKLRNLKDVYSLSDTMITVLSLDSSIVWLKYNPNQNVIDEDVIFVTSDDSTIGLAVDVVGFAYYGDSYDATTFNRYDNELKGVLTSLVSNHTSLGYNTARDKMYMEIDNQKVNGQGATVNTLECVYTGRKAVGYIDRTDAQNNYNFNTEHTWPQSNFSEQEPMKSDLFHLYPTDNPANGVRSNYPFGKVVSNITWDSAESKLGRNSLNEIVFEPRDVHKGDVSRSMFYFITRYPTNYGGFFTQTQENVFREWNKLDNVGVVESNRNTAIANYQGKRNPYIDHPEFADRIYSFATNNTRPRNSELDLLPFVIEFDSTKINDTTSAEIYIINIGNNSLTIDSIIVSDPHFILTDASNEVEPYSVWKSVVQFIPDSAKYYSSIIKVYSDGGIKQLSLSGIGKDYAVSVDDEILQSLTFSLSQNYPNPFNPLTSIHYAIGKRQFVTLKVYDILGNEIVTLVNDEKSAGNYEVNFNASNIPSGVYFYHLQAGSFIQTNKMILLK
jgi:endonuclease I